jgi:Papain family cysteine protease
MSAKGMGYVKDPLDNRDFLWRSVVRQERVSVPKSGRIWARGPVLDQGMTPQCVAYSSASLKFHQEWRDHHRYYNFDPEQLYFRCKEVDNWSGDGTFIRTAMNLLQNEGMLARAARRELKEDTYFKTGNFVRMQTLQEIKEALYLIGPVVFGITVDETIERVLPNGFWAEPTQRPIGGHAMVIFGWSDFTETFLIKNSWGTEWGRDGYALFPYSHFEAYPDWDAWKTIDQLAEDFA